MSEFLDDIMGFDPNNLEAFQEPVNNNDWDKNIYKTNPIKYSKADDGHYRAKVKLLFNPLNLRKSIVKQATYWIEDADGGLLVRSKLGNDDRSCPLFTAWKKLWFSNDAAKKEWAREMFDKNESQWCLVQILEDENQPELVGKIMVWKLPKSVFVKMEAKMKPSDSKKTPMPIMDYLIGNPLELDVTPGPDDPSQPQRKMREISYDLCDFENDYAPIIKIDGTPLFTETELETIDSYANAKNEVVKARTQAKKDAAQEVVNNLKDQMRELYQKALDYLKDVTLDLEKECAYQEWDEATTKRVNEWISMVLNMKNPKIPELTAVIPFEPETQITENPVDNMMDVDSNDLPF